MSNNNLRNTIDTVKTYSSFETRWIDSRVKIFNVLWIIYEKTYISHYRENLRRLRRPFAKMGLFWYTINKFKFNPLQKDCVRFSILSSLNTWTHNIIHTHTPTPRAYNIKYAHWAFLKLCTSQGMLYVLYNTIYGVLRIQRPQQRSNTNDLLNL